VTNEEVLHRVKKERKANWMVKSCVGTVFQNILLKARHREGYK